MEKREANYKIMDEILQRWSPRAFDSQKEVKDEDIFAILEAARHAPSCYNEQPWEYIISKKNDKVYKKIANSLIEYNQGWALEAPVLAVVLSRKQFKLNEKSNRWHLFDAGTSWGFLSLEAQRRNIMTHAMGGFRSADLRKEFQISIEYSIIAIIAIGYYGRKEELKTQYLSDEKPSPRKKLQDMLYKVDENILV